MRTTLTLDNDVAASLARVQKSRKIPLKTAVNEALRQGLKQMTTAARPQTPFRTGTMVLGRCLIGNVDDVAEALALAEGERFS